MAVFELNTVPSLKRDYMCKCSKARAEGARGIYTTGQCMSFFRHSGALYPHRQSCTRKRMEDYQSESGTYIARQQSRSSGKAAKYPTRRVSRHSQDLSRVKKNDHELSLFPVLEKKRSLLFISFGNFLTFQGIRAAECNRCLRQTPA